MKLPRYKQKYVQKVGIYLEPCTVTHRYLPLKLFFEDKCAEILVKSVYGAETKCEEMNIFLEKNNQILTKPAEKLILVFHCPKKYK